LILAEIVMCGPLHCYLKVLFIILLNQSPQVVWPTVMVFGIMDLGETKK